MRTSKINALAERWKVIQARAGGAAERAGRDPASVRIMAVTKTLDRAVVDQAIELGIQHIGENRVQEARAKFLDPPLGRHIALHLIGQLQTNKARPAVRLFDVVESVDRPPLVEALAREAEKQERRLSVLVQVNIAREQQKAGCDPNELGALVRQVQDTRSLELRGLMTIAPLTEDVESVRPVFRELRRLQEALRASSPSVELPELSMGMSNDLEVAVEEGATLIRVGRALFGERH